MGWSNRYTRLVAGLCLVALAVYLSASIPWSLAPAHPSPPSPTRADEYAAARQTLANRIRLRGVDEEVLMVLELVPRHEFVPEEYRNLAYEDRPLPIGYGQTISQPYIVGLMTEELGVKPGDKVLEIGTGSGYQAAILAAMGLEVYSLEIIPELARAADERLKRLGYQVTVKQGDGYLGWPEHAPYDAIIVTAAPDHVPRPLFEQLKVGGRLVIPVGPPGGYQTLWRFTKINEEEWEAHDLGGVAFVPMVHGK